jgi:hypothetical protein
MAKEGVAGLLIVIEDAHFVDLQSLKVLGNLSHNEIDDLSLILALSVRSGKRNFKFSRV